MHFEEIVRSIMWNADGNNPINKLSGFEERYNIGGWWVEKWFFLSGHVFPGKSRTMKSMCTAIQSIQYYTTTNSCQQWSCFVFVCNADLRYCRHSRGYVSFLQIRPYVGRIGIVGILALFGVRFCCKKIKFFGLCRVWFKDFW